MTVLIRIIRHVMIMALMLAIAMMITAMQRCTSIVRARGSQPATPFTNLKRQQHLLQGIGLLPRKALPCRPESRTRSVASEADGDA